MTLALPPALGRELAAQRRALGDGAAPRCFEDAATVARLFAWVRRALAASHLVSVAGALHQAFGADLPALRMLRLPVDLLPLFPRWQEGSRAGFRVQPTGLQVAPAGAALPLGAARLHVAPDVGTAALMLRLLGQLVPRLDRDVALTLVVESARDWRTLTPLLRAALGPAARRARTVALASATVYARDNGLLARDAAGGPVLVIPRGFRPERGCPLVPLAPRAAARSLDRRVVRSLLYWEGGNIVQDGARWFIGADTIVENRMRLGLHEDEIFRILAAEFGSTPIVLGDLRRARYDPETDRMTRSGQASYHIDLDVALLGTLPGRARPVAMVADPALGLALLPAVVRDPVISREHFAPQARARRLITAEYRAAGRERGPLLAAYRARIREAGCDVVHLPDLRGQGKRSPADVRNLDLTACNLVAGRCRGRPAVYYLPWGVRAFDTAVASTFRSLGVRPIPVGSTPHLAHAFMRLGAGLRCLWGPLG